MKRKTTTKPLPTAINGLSLIELMVALLLSSLILCSSFYLLHNELSHYYRQQKQVGSLENQRYAQFILTNAIHMAGYWGCQSLQHRADSAIALEAYTSAQIPKYISNVKSGSEVLAITFANPQPAYLTNDMLTPSSALTLNTPPPFIPGQTAIISDCQQTDVFQVARRYSNKIYPQQALSKAYPKNSLINQLENRWFFLRENADGESTGLFMQDQTGHTDEIIADIESLKFKFAQRTQPQQFLPTNNITAWQTIKKVHVEIVYTNHLEQQFTVDIPNQ